MVWHTRPNFSHAMSVAPEPPNGSRTTSPDFEEFARAYPMSSTGFCVLWLTQTSVSNAGTQEMERFQTLVLSRIVFTLPTFLNENFPSIQAFFDVARPASPSVDPSSGEVPVRFVDSKEASAYFTRLEPFSFLIKNATGVMPLMLNGIDSLEVINSIVLLVPVDMVDLDSFRDFSIVSFPFDDVSHPVPLLGVVVDSVVSLRSGISVSGRMSAVRSLFSHGFSVSERFVLASISSPSDMKRASVHVTLPSCSTRNGWFPVHFTVFHSAPISTMDSAGWQVTSSTVP